MNFKNLLSFCITFSLLASTQLDASGPSTVEQELAKQKKYFAQLNVLIMKHDYGQNNYFYSLLEWPE